MPRLFVLSDLCYSCSLIDCQIICMSLAKRTPCQRLGLFCTDGKAVDVARQDIWGLLQAAAKPELRRVFAAAHLRPCWLDTGKCPLPDTMLRLSDRRYLSWRAGSRQCTGNSLCMHGPSCMSPLRDLRLLSYPGLLSRVCNLPCIPEPARTCDQLGMPVQKYRR